MSPVRRRRTPAGPRRTAHFSKLPGVTVWGADGNGTMGVNISRTKSGRAGLMVVRREQDGNVSFREGAGELGPDDALAIMVALEPFAELDS